MRPHGWTQKTSVLQLLYVSTLLYAQVDLRTYLVACKHSALTRHIVRVGFKGTVWMFRVLEKLAYGK